MSCGANIIKTVLFIGSVDKNLVKSVSQKNFGRALHLVIDDSDRVGDDDDNYRVMKLSGFDRVKYMALFIQYDFPLIVASSGVTPEELKVVCQEQWYGEQEKNYLVEVSSRGTFTQLKFEGSKDIGSLDALITSILGDN